jgi:VWFA-related protein
MLKRFQSIVAFVLLLALIPPVIGQQPTSSGNVPSQDERVSITTNLTQVDVIVTDKEGNQVSDLRPEEFEITEEGKKQQITNFSYITAGALPASAGAIQPATTELSSTGKSSTTTVPPVRLKPEQVRRTVALLVDDLGVSFESMNVVRKALRNFVDQQMQPGDLVAILRTSGGTGTLQQFTTDKRVLNAAIENMRWLPRGRGELTPFDSSINPSSEMQTTAYTREALQDLRSSRDEILSVGTIGTLNLVLRSLVDLPGRKSVILLTENVQIFDASGNRSERLVEVMKQLADYSNRASAVVYTVDTSGLQTLGVTAAQSTEGARLQSESIGGMTATAQSRTPSANPDRSVVGNPQENLRALDVLAETRRATYFESQGVLKYLAELTGGIAIKNTNDISGGLGRALEDQKGYYLIGYRPDVPPVDPKTGQRRQLKVSVKVKRPNVRVRSRNNFYALADEVKPSGRATRDQQLVTALNSPFAGDLRMRLTSLFNDDQSIGSFVRAMVYVDARDLKFSDEADGNHKASLDIVALTLDASGRVVDQVSSTETISTKGDTYQRILEHGLTYMLNVPVKQPGAYQVRVAVRDTASERVGSASQYIGIPNLAKGALTLSGIVLSGISMDAATKNSREEPTPQAGPAVRRLKHGMVLDYGYVVYNAALDRSTNSPQLTTQLRVFRDGKPIFSGRVTPLDVSGQKDMKRLVGGGRIQVGTQMTPGDYVLQVIVADTLIKEKDKEKRRTATQWIDFEVVR